MAFYSTEERKTVLKKLSILEHHVTIYLETLKRNKKKNHLSAWASENLEKCLESVKRGLDNKGNTFHLFLCVERALQYITIAKNRFQGAYYKEKFSLFYDLLAALLPVDYAVQLKLFDTEKFVDYIDMTLKATKHYLEYFIGKIDSWASNSKSRYKKYMLLTPKHTCSVVQLELQLIF